MIRETTRVVICDDDALRAEAWASEVREIGGVQDALDIKALPTAEFAAALDALSARRENARSEPPVSTTDDAASVFDGADVLVVDFDLTPDPYRLKEVLDPDAAEHAKEALRGRSGEHVAYLARCYSSAGFIVLVNKEYQAQTFDLTMQRFTSSYADLNVTHRDLVASALWVGNGGDDVFRPWSWPRLLDAAALYRSRIAAVGDGTAPVLEALGFSGVDRMAMTSRQLDALGDEPDATTFDDLVENVEVGLQPKDRQSDERQRRRIAAAAVGRWLESLVLPAQNVIIDTPHLAQRYPQVLASRADDIDAWQELTAHSAHPDGMKAVAVACEGWLSRTAWPASAAREAMANIEVPAETADVVFCEDISRFVALDDAVEFESDVPGPYDQRFVRRLKGVDYHPRVRLLK